MMPHSLLCVLYAQRTTLTKCRSERVTLVGRYEWGNASSPPLKRRSYPPKPTPTERAGQDEQDAGPLVFLRAFYAENDDILSPISSDFHSVRHTAAAQVAGAGAVIIDISRTENELKTRTGSDDI